MKLTHHTKATGSFIALLIIVLVVVYASLLLSKIQKRTISQENSPIDYLNRHSKIDTTNWQSYEDNSYPLKLSFPKEWTYSADITSLAGYYTVNLFPQDSKNPIRVYISDKDFVAINGLSGKPKLIVKDLTATNYEDLIYTIKVGEYYYTFDASLNQSYKEELAEIVRLARFE